MKFIDGGQGVNFYETGNPVHSWFIGFFQGVETDHTVTWQRRRNLSLVEVGGIARNFEIGIPFRGSHRPSNPFQSICCRYIYHTIGISRSHLPVRAFVFSSEYALPTAQCPHSVDLDGAQSRLDWCLVAGLGGWHRGRSSLGTVMAVSPGGSRIAAATWDHLLIWTLDGEVLQRGTLRQYFPVCDYSESKRCGLLRPTKLSTDGIGVIYSLRWASEVSLFADTELGLVQWDMGITSTGQRQTLSLDQEA